MNIEELQEKFEQLASTIDWIKTKLVDLQEEKGLAPVKTPYEVEVPEDIDEYYYVSITGIINKLCMYDEFDQIEIYKRGLAFRTEEEVKQFDKERILIKKLKDWAKKYNGSWKPNWEDVDEEKKSVGYDNENEKIAMFRSYKCQDFSKLPYFKSKRLAQQFIEEFGEEINEVLC